MSVVVKLYREFDTFSVDIKNWKLLDQGISALWGPSGAGKSTVLRTLVGLEPEASLEWMWDDRDLGQLPAAQRELGLVFQEYALFPHLTAQQNILFPVNKSKHSQWQSDFHELSEILQLESFLTSPVHNLSGGEKQRVALARALIYRPRMLLLDEPFSSLDDKIREKAWKLIKKVNQSFSCPVLLVTHDRRDVEALAGQISEMERGQILKTLILS